MRLNLERGRQIHVFVDEFARERVCSLGGRSPNLKLDQTDQCSRIDGKRDMCGPQSAVICNLQENFGSYARFSDLGGF